MQSKNEVIQGCNSESCRLKCSVNISKIRRTIINKDYWSQSTDNKRKWLAVRIEKHPIAPQKKKSQNTYRLTNGCGENVQVCQKFFLSTLGKKDGRDQIIRTTLDSIPEGETLPTPSRRGKHSKQKMLDKDNIRKHIMSFNPQVSHYRRAHAPNRLYLPSDINIKFMFAHYIKNLESQADAVSYVSYCRVLKEMKISFTKLGEEECETCSKHELHKLTSHVDMVECKICVNFAAHQNKFREARESYTKDKASGVKAYAVDLQKVGVLPYIEQFKVAIFTPRLVTFNETFAPLGGATENNPNIAVLWH